MSLEYETESGKWNWVWTNIRLTCMWSPALRHIFASTDWTKLQNEARKQDWGYQGVENVDMEVVEI